MPIPRPGAGAFSLVEMLVALSIVAAVTALALPSLQRAAVTARAGSCLANLAGMQRANLVYAADHGGSFVPDFLIGPTTATRIFWYANPDYCSLMGVASVATTWPKRNLCPMAAAALKAGGRIDLAYGYNANGMGGGLSTPGSVRGWQQTQVPRPSKTIAFADALDWQIFYSNARAYAGEAGTQGAIAYRHDGGAHVAYWDGHAEWLVRSALQGDIALWESNQ